MLTHSCFGTAYFQIEIGFGSVNYYSFCIVAEVALCTADSEGLGTRTAGL